MDTLINHRELQSRILLKIKNWGCRALLPALLVPFVGLSGGCYDSYNVSELEGDRDAIIRSIERYREESIVIQGRVDELEKKAEGAVEAQAGIDAALSEKRDDEQEIEAYEAKLRLTMHLLKSCQESFQIKIDLEPGAKFELIVMKDGNKLKNAVFRSYSPQSIKFSHSGGIGSYAVDQMPDMIAKYYLLPPESPLSAADPNAIFARKPDSLKTYGQIKKDKEKAYEARYAASKLESKLVDDKRAAERQAEIKKRESAQQSERKIQEALMAEDRKKKSEIAVLQASLRKYQAAYNELKRAYDIKVNSYNSGIKIAAADREKSLSGFKTKGAALRQEIAKLEAHIAALGGR